MPLKFIQFFQIPHRKISALILNFLFGSLLIETSVNSQILKIIAYIINFLIVFLVLKLIYWVAKNDYDPGFIKREVKMKMTIHEAMKLGMEPRRWSLSYEKEEYDARYEWGLQNTVLMWGAILYLVFIAVFTWSYLFLLIRVQNFPFLMNLRMLPYAIIGFISYSAAISNIHNYFYYQDQRMKKDQFYSVFIVMLSVTALFYCLTKLVFQI